MSGIYRDDFRLSVRPETAERRLQYFKRQIELIQGQILLHDLAGLPREQFGIDHVTAALESIFRAHVRFAEAQIRNQVAPKAEAVAR